MTSGSVTFSETRAGEKGLECVLLADATPPVWFEPDVVGAVFFGRSDAAAASAPVSRLDASAARAPQTLLRFAVSSSVGEGAPDSTITTVTRNTVPPRVRALMRYVPLGSWRPRSRPLNGTLFRPG
jgi:hypothetical protein